MESMKFEPFEKVLVRNSKDEAWRSGLFENKLSEGHYLCMNGTYKYCVKYEGNEELLDKTAEPVFDLPIDTPVMCNCGANKTWQFGYYAGHCEIWMYGCRSKDKVGKCEWYNIVPFSLFDPEDLDGNMQHNIVKHESQKG